MQFLKHMIEIEKNITQNSIQKQNKTKMKCNKKKKKKILIPI